jgi:Ca-activated chloride channel family protein
VIALEELNALAAWSARQTWAKAPALPELDRRLLRTLDVGVRIVLSWDADGTDVDLHVVEPSREEAMYSHALTTIGGMVSSDCTRGYGPEEYLVRVPMAGTYKIYAKYYGSSQQTIVGPATITATVFTNFGRANETRQVLTLRLDSPKDLVPIGEITVPAAPGKQGK